MSKVCANEVGDNHCHADEDVDEHCAAHDSHGRLSDGSPEEGCLVARRPESGLPGNSGVRVREGGPVGRARRLVDRERRRVQSGGPVGRARRLVDRERRRVQSGLRARHDQAQEPDCIWL